jgi:hypothetical protein
MRLFIVAIAWFLLILPADATDGSKKSDELCSQVQALITEFYPKATFEKKNGTFIGKFNTRMFMIHHALKTGEWQEASQQEGPNKGGIVCRIQNGTGPYMGAAMVPQTFDYRYFNSLLMAPENKATNTHLIAHLDYPSGVSVDFVNRYRKLISSYAGDKNQK